MKLPFEQLNQKAVEIRISIVESLTSAGSGHLGGSLSMTDLFTYLYFHLLNHNPQNPSWENRDRLVLSNGHIAPVLYASLAHSGYFAVGELQTLRQLGSRLQGHPSRAHGLPGIELAAGSLGQGVGVSVGMALAAKHLKQNHKIFCIAGDGEMQEGSVWEAAMSAANFKLDNLIWIVDRNQLQIDGNTEEVMKIEPLNEKFKSFGWEVAQCNGHDFEDIDKTFKEIMQKESKPKLIIAKTTMGKGIKQIENNYKWHGKVPSRDELPIFIQELKSKTAN